MLEPWIDLRAIGVVSEPLPFDLPGERPPDAEVRTFKMVMPEYLEMESPLHPALLTLALANYPGWRAEINGEPADIVDTYAGLIRVPVPAGAAQKVTHAMPQSLIAGGVISAVTFAGLSSMCSPLRWPPPGALRGGCRLLIWKGGVLLGAGPEEAAMLTTSEPTSPLFIGLLLAVLVNVVLAWSGLVQTSFEYDYQRAGAKMAGIFFLLSLAMVFVSLLLHLFGSCAGRWRC